MLFCSSLKMLQKVSNILKAPFGGRGVTLTSSSSATCELLQHSRTSKFSRCGCSIGRNELLLGSLKGRCPFSVPLLWAAPGTQSKRLPSCPVVSWKRNGSTLKWWCKLAVLCWLCWQCRKNRSWRLFHPLRYDMLWCFPSSILSLEKKNVNIPLLKSPVLLGLSSQIYLSSGTTSVNAPLHKFRLSNPMVTVLSDRAISKRHQRTNKGQKQPRDSLPGSFIYL